MIKKIILWLELIKLLKFETNFQKKKFLHFLSSKTIKKLSTIINHLNKFFVVQNLKITNGTDGAITL